MLNSKTQQHDLNQMLAQCLESADSMYLSLVAIKICEAIELLDNKAIEPDDA
jgi:hypothetical protein